MIKTTPFISPFVDSNATALTNNTKQVVTYGELRELSDLLSQEYTGGIALFQIANKIHELSLYIAFVEARIPIMLVDQNIDRNYFDVLVESYKPSIVVTEHSIARDYEKSTNDDKIWHRKTPGAPVNPLLGMMLTTSGSTGNPKFVRLSHDAVRANARDIAAGLDVDETHRAITCLPSSYTYGLSIVNSHIHAGASIVVTDETVVSKEFWELVEEFSITSFAGVPTSYKLLKQMRWSPSRYKSLKYVTQAGGRLHDEDRLYFLDLLGSYSIKFIIMYGQTEATARITICPADFLESNISTAGFAIPNGELFIDDQDENGIGSVFYKGPNVMLGYAETAEDLLLGDVNKGTLETGDLGYLLNGALFLTGRSKRIVKVFGIRVSLDDVDSWINKTATGVALQGNDCLEIFVEKSDANVSDLKTELSRKLSVHSSGIRIHEIDALPLLNSGKIDMQTLAGMVK